MKKEFCDGPLWNASSWANNAPVLTKCIENTVIVYIPAIFMLIGGLFHLCVATKKQPEVLLSASLLSITKLATNSILIIVHIYNFCSHLVNSQADISDVIAGGLHILIFSLALLIQIIDRKNGVYSSKFISVFWFLETICDSLVYYHNVIVALTTTADLSATQQLTMTIWSISFPLTVVTLILFSITETLTGLDPKNRNPIYWASPFSKLLLGYFTKFIINGYRRSLTVDELPEILDEMQSENCYREWKDTINRPVAIVPTIFKTYWRSMIFVWIMETLYCSARVGVFYILNKLILSLSGSDGNGYMYSAAIFLIYISSGLVQRWSDYVVVRLAIRIKTILIGAIVRKSLRISTTQLGQYTVGELVNLLSVDTDKINQFSYYIGIMVGSPVNLILSTAMVWQFLGPSCLIGLSVMVLLMPVSGAVASISRKVQIKQMNLKDTRLKYISEILSSMKIVKFYGWEPPFLERIQKVRYDENVLLKRFAYLSALLKFFWSITPFLVSLVAFVAYLYMNNLSTIDTNVALVSLSIFNNMRLTLSTIPDIISNAIQTMVSVRRIEKFLNADELNENLVGNNPGDGNAARWDDATLNWNPNENKSTLKNINLVIKKGELVAIVGRVGSGKSSLLSSMLGDLCLQKGQVDISGSIAYVPQQAWIQNATVRQNILFTEQYSNQVYKETVNKCCLQADLEIFPKGDRTEIGEKGVNLSGGQKQRISLARAVYQNRDVYFLDDPLSAVDAHVGVALFRDVIGNTGMLKDKTRLFVTNMLSVLPYVDRIVVLKDGEIVEQGSFKDLRDSTGEFAEFLKEHTKESNDEFRNSVKYEEEVLQEDELLSVSTNASTVSEQDELISEERMEIGAVNGGVYRRYLSKVGFCFCVTILIGFGAARALEIYSGFWLSDWSTDKSQGNNHQSRTRRIIGYAILGFLYGLFSFIGTAALVSGAVTASRRLHDRMLKSVIRAPMSFFDRTPLGRLLNRFGKDVDQLDIQLPVVANAFIEMFFQLVGVLVLISINLPIFLTALVPLLVIYVAVQRIFIRSSRQIKRIESVTRSPVYNHFSEVLSGLSSIRAYKVQTNFIATSDLKVDLTQNCTYLLYLCKMWLSTRLDILSNFIILASNILIVQQKAFLAPQTASFMVSYAMGASFFFNYMVQYVSDIEAGVVASERVDEYSDIVSEAPWITETRPESSWPSEGSVIFDNYSTRYREGLDLVLRGVDLKIESGEKIGVVGRTGAGKSSLTMSLFRIIEAAFGYIMIDGKDISELGLHDVRPKLTIIPQDPVIFSGTLRINLDPNSIYNDENLWNALERANAKDQFLNEGLDTEITEGGTNLSVGQRQLICLARAILQKTKILILDEATASVDVQTDALIQKTIRADFADCTVITIAHRLNTIMDSDRVIVMDFGKIVEQGSPQDLLQDSSSRFHAMAKDAGLITND